MELQLLDLIRLGVDAGVAITVVYLIVTGRLVPERTHRAQLDSRDRLNATLQQSLANRDETVQDLTHLLMEMQPGFRNSAAVIRSLPNEGDEPSPRTRNEREGT